MKRFLFSSGLCCLTVIQVAFCQSSAINRNTFFNDTSIWNATIVAKMANLFHSHQREFTFYGNFIATLPDGTQVNERVQLTKRGHSRGELCYVPPLLIKFNYKDSAALGTLKTLKLVSECKIPEDQLLLKEFLIYKMYNLIDKKSFRVRLVKMNFQDSAGKSKTVSEYAFLLEDVKDLAKRNNCTEFRGRLNQEFVDRHQMTIVALFQYMIGNTDWGVSVDHNIRLLSDKKDSTKKPYAVPYDFDFSGLVNAYYALPDDRLGIESVTQRVYRGYSRTMPELQEALDTFRLKKNEIYSLIKEFGLLTPKTKREMTDYLDDFFKQIQDPQGIKQTFITGALKD